MKKITYLLLLTCISNFAQIKGTVTDEKGNPLPFVTIFSSNTYNGTTSNDNGKYELNRTEYPLKSDNDKTKRLDTNFKV